MTQINLSKNGDFVELTVLGHCNAGRINGNDLCCCAVSMLVFTLMESLGKLSPEGYFSKYASGWCYVRFVADSKSSEKAKIITDTVMNGFRLLEKRFPASVCIETSLDKPKQRRNKNGSDKKCYY